MTASIGNEPADVKPLLDEISGAAREFYAEAIDPVAERFAFSRRQTEGEIKGPPIVLMLGNHSSGKSSFINYVLGEEVQKTGLAPTDDGFSIIAYGDQRDDRDGPGVVSNPQLPYEGLRHFGDTLVTHLRLKLRPIELLKNVILVDSPGMVDEATAESTRGFDFPAVVKWFAERADVVIVFFDPDKPGTTSETLRIFDQSLRGIDHKLLVVMNKMDQFRSLNDFARAYGALCWNLAQVIPKKDLPLIYTTFVPVANAPEPGLPLEDFVAARHELADEVKRAPARRVDNMLTQVQTFAERLRLHARVIDGAARRLRGFRRRIDLGVLAAVLVLAGAAAFSYWASGLDPLTITLIVIAVLLVPAGLFLARTLTRREERHVIDTLPDVFEKLYAREFLVRERSDDLRALWAVIQDRTRKTAENLGLLSFPKLRSSELSRLDEVIEHRIPRLRSELHERLAQKRSAAAGEH